MTGTPAASHDAAFLRDLVETRSWTLGQPTQIQVTPDGAQVLFLRSEPRRPVQHLFVFDVASKATRELASPELILRGAAQQLSPEEKAQRERMRVTVMGFSGYELSRDGSQVLLTLSGRAYTLALQTGAVREALGTGPRGEPVFDAHLSPDGTLVAAVRGGELWVAPIDGSQKPRQLTVGASEFVTHAQAEFVAQEELARFRGYWWSPDSQSLLYEEADLRGVEKLYFADLAHPERPVEPTAYPRPGKANAKTRFGLISIKGGPTTWLALPAHAEYVADVRWSKGGPLTLLTLSRDQRDLWLVAADGQGQVRELLAEHDPAFLNCERTLRWLPSGEGFLWSTEVRGAWQLELRRPDGSLWRELTAVGAGFRHLAGYDEVHQRALAMVGQTPLDSQVVSISLEGKIEPLTRGPRSHAGIFGRDPRVWVRAGFSPTEVREVDVVDAQGRVIAPLPSVAAAAPFKPAVSIAQVGPHGFWTSLVRPRDFDPHRKYPVLAMVYGGPHANMVVAAEAAYLTDQFIADHGYLVFRADGRGTPLRGREWERAIAKNFAEVPLADQVAALQARAAMEPAMDLSRVGVMGHSFGGFMAALSVMRRPDVYRAGIAGAPVVDWSNYDTAYTERYLGVPAPAGDSDAYARNGLLPYAKELSRPLLILHGTADDNVHFSESLLLSDALFRAGKQAELVPQLGQTHLFFDPELRLRYWERVFEFFGRHLEKLPG